MLHMYELIKLPPLQLMTVLHDVSRSNHTGPGVVLPGSLHHVHLHPPLTDMVPNTGVYCPSSSVPRLSPCKQAPSWFGSDSC